MARMRGWKVLANLLHGIRPEACARYFDWLI